jgi:hypothetical protein
LRLRPTAALLPESNTVAVMPFRVSADASLDYLGEGMLDLLAEVVSVPPRLSLSARLVSVRDGSVAYRASVDGPADSLPALVDRLAAQLLLVQAGEAEHRLDAATSTSLSALTSYLHGQALFRQGRIEEGLDRFLHALELDSTFALAALGAWSAQAWGIMRPGVGERVRKLAWAHRERLSERDRLHLLALAGPEFPDESTAARRLEATQRAVSAAPDRDTVAGRAGSRAGAVACGAGEPLAHPLRTVLGRTGGGRPPRLRSA